MKNTTVSFHYCSKDIVRICSKETFDQLSSHEEDAAFVGGLLAWYLPPSPLAGITFWVIIKMTYTFTLHQLNTNTAPPSVKHAKSNTLTWYNLQKYGWTIWEMLFTVQILIRWLHEDLEHSVSLLILHAWNWEPGCLLSLLPLACHIAETHVDILLVTL